MKRWKIILSFVVVFAAGVAVGGAISLHFARDFFLSPPEPNQMAGSIMKHLQSELNLTAEQVEKIKPIVIETTREAAAYQHEVLGRIGEIFEKSDREIGAHLSPEQQARFKKIQERRPHPKDH